METETTNICEACNGEAIYTGSTEVTGKRLEEPVDYWQCTVCGHEWYDLAD